MAVIKKNHLLKKSTFLLIVFCSIGPTFAAESTAEPETPKKPEKAPLPLPEVNEVTKIEPDFVYRLSLLNPRKKSAFFKKEYEDYIDQLYLTIRYSKIYDFRHKVVLEPTLRTKRNRPENLEPVIEQGYIETEFEKNMIVTAGKKCEFEGSGFFINPSDLLNEDKDIFDNLAQREGKVFSKVTYKFNEHLFSLGFIPQRGMSANDGKFWLKTSGTLWETDIHLQYTVHKAEKSTTGLSLARFFTDSFELHWDGRYQARQRDEAQQRERPFSVYNKDSGSGYYLFGSRYVLTPKRTVVGEYIQNQSGLAGSEMENFMDYIRQATDEEKDIQTRIIGRHYGFFAFQDEDSFAKTMLGTSFLINTDDSSSFASLQIRHHFSALTSFEFSPTFFNGRRNSEFGEAPFSGVYYLVFRGRF